MKNSQTLYTARFCVADIAISERNLPSEGEAWQWLNDVTKALRPYLKDDVALTGEVHTLHSLICSLPTQPEPDTE